MGYAQNSAQSSLAACPAATDVTALHLYGAWQARWDGVDEPAALTLGRNPDHPDSLRGSIQRGSAQAPVRAQVAGDVDRGEFTLEESADGQSISAIWSGAVVADACGKEIRGVWTATGDRKERSFVLRKLPGWQ